MLTHKVGHIEIGRCICVAEVKMQKERIPMPLLKEKNHENGVSFRRYAV